MITALKSTGFFQSLAEPNLIAYNGEEASFLAGGEVPVPVVQGGTSNAVTVVYKEFGIRLTFKPTIAGDVIRLMVRPEVSALDFANGVSLSGFRIPALTTRRAETHVELRDGQSFAIAGLLDNLTQDDGAGDPAPEQAADHRQPVQEQVRARRAHRADGADHAAPGAAARSGRSAAAADAAEALPRRAGKRRRSASRSKAAPASSTRRDEVEAARQGQEAGNEAGPVRMSHAVSVERFGSERGAVFVQVGIAHVRARRVQRVRAGLRRDVDRAEPGAERR